MKYMWSKNRISKYLLPIILKDRKPNQWYVEPFVWGANMIDKVDGNRIWGDINKYLVSFLQKLSHWEFKYRNNFYTREQYNEIRYNKEEYERAEVWYVWINCSYWWSWFESYSWKSNTAKWERNYQQEAIRNIEKQLPWLKGVHFEIADYTKISTPFIDDWKTGAIIYCDKPYKWVREYNFDKWFNHTEFWEWCREKKKEWHTVFVSEYNAPEDFKCVWEKEVKSSLSANWKSWRNKNSTEKLFTI